MLIAWTMLSCGTLSLFTWGVRRYDVRAARAPRREGRVEGANEEGRMDVTAAEGKGKAKGLYK